MMKQEIMKTMGKRKVAAITNSFLGNEYEINLLGFTISYLIRTGFILMRE